jgi:hypothetical protein
MPETEYLGEWAIAFIWTLALEGALIAILLSRQPPTKLLTAFLAANCLSHTSLWFVFPVFEPYWAWVTSAEIAVTVYEGLVYWTILRPRISAVKAAFVSVVANTTSCAFGLLT